MFSADVLIDSQLIGFLANKFNQLSIRRSRPAWARGLKQLAFALNTCVFGRAPRGRVD